MKHPNDKKDCFRIDVIDEVCCKAKRDMGSSYAMLQVITKSTKELVDIDAKEALALTDELDQPKASVQNAVNREELGSGKDVSNEKPKLKVLPPHLKYSFLEGNKMKPVIISSSLTAEEERRVISVLKANQGAIG